jgi:hypothetical protein
VLFPRLWAPFRHREESNQVHDVLPPSAEEVARAQAGQVSLVEAAAIKIRADEAGAPSRRAAIRYLASVRCHYFPEAEAALIAALRADRNETVRIEAAQALAGGCCCTSKTMEALLLAVSGSERDGNAGETSERVRAVANIALQHFAARGFTVPHPETLPPSTQKALSKGLQLTSAELPPDATKLAPMPLRAAEAKTGEGVASSCSCTSKASSVFTPALKDLARSDHLGVLYLPPPTPPPPEPTASSQKILQATFTERADQSGSTARIKPVAYTAKQSLATVTEAELRFAETAGVTPPPGSEPSHLPSTVAPPSAPETARAVESLPAIRLAPIGVLPPQLPR